MAQGKVEICGVNTAKLPILKEEEKDALFVRIKAGDKEAKEEYIKGNLRLVLSVIKRFSNSNENPDDLFQIGCIGLIKAINNFNTEYSVKFSTYAVPMNIHSRNSKENFTMTRKQAVSQAIAELKKIEGMEELVHNLEDIHEDLPVTLWDEKTIFDAIDQFCIDNGRYPSGSDFQKRGLPSLSSIKNRFDMTLIPFMEKYYPQRSEMKKCNSNVYYSKTAEEWLEVFKEQFYKHNNHNMESYNADRDAGTPCWYTIARLNGVTSFNALLKLCDFPIRSQNAHSRLKPERQRVMLSLNRSYVDSDKENLDKLNEELKQAMEECAQSKKQND